MDWQKEDLKYIWHPCSQMKDYETLPPIVIERGQGINLYDINGKCYKDVISSWWCNLLGHCNPRINNAVKKQIDSLEHVIFANFTHKPAITLCQELMKVLPKGLKDEFSISLPDWTSGEKAFYGAHGCISRRNNRRAFCRRSRFVFRTV